MARFRIHRPIFPFFRKLFVLLMPAAAWALPFANGGFESGMTNWTTAVKPGAVATLGTIIERNHSGGNCLKVSIAGNGNQDSLARLVSGPIVLDTGRIYMLRFWSVAKSRAALVDLRIGANGSFRRCHFEIYDSDGPWHRYQYLFKPTVKDAAITMVFGTATDYYLDDVELLDEQDTLLDIKTQYMWQSLHVGWGWISGDNDVSMPLPDGRNAWILNDSFTGMVNDQSNVLKDVKMINNLIVIEEHKPNPTLSAIFAGVAGAPKPLFPPGALTIYWIADAMVAGNTFQILLQEWNVAFDFNHSAFIATLSLPDLKVQSVVKTAYKGPDIPNALLPDKGYTYIYTANRPDKVQRNTRIARVPAGSFDPKAPWEFMAADGSWTTDSLKAARMLTGVEIASAVKLGDSNYVFSGIGSPGDALEVRFAKTPIGPWTAPVSVYKPPQEAGIIPYLGHIHRGLKQDGVYTLSYSLFPATGGWFQQLSDRGCYMPQYVKVNLEKLSPYTKKTPTRLARRPPAHSGHGLTPLADHLLTGRKLQHPK